jgi:hypothetical protein
MNKDYQQDPYQQDPFQRESQDQPWQGEQEQYGTQQERYGQSSQRGESGPGTPQDQYSIRQEQYGQSAQQSQRGKPGMLSDARRMAEQQIDQVIDQFGNKVPGATQYTQQAKDAVGGILDNLEREVENRMGNMGGTFGGGGQGS